MLATKNAKKTKVGVGECETLVACHVQVFLSQRRADAEKKTKSFDAKSAKQRRRRGRKEGIEEHF